jgi:RHS repeat-associated protein
MLLAQYDANGNRLTASDGTLTITATYDRLNRPLTVDDDGVAGADTTYAYSLTSPSWTDPTGTYLVTLDAFDRQTSVDGPAVGAFTTSYRADGQPSSAAAPNGNTTAFTYDGLGRETGRSTTASGPTNRAVYSLAYNRAGQVTSESSTISGDPTNGATAYAYDPLARLTSYTPPTGSAQAYGWDEVPNRTSVTVGAASPVTTTYDAANRPSSDSAGGSYASDPDGRLQARPGQRLAWDGLGRLAAVRPATGYAPPLASYSYDPLDRLRVVDYGTSRIRFRYVGLTTSVAQVVDDTTGSVIRSVGTGWTGERLLDWTGTNSNLRYYGSNAHHDVTWTADATGAVAATLRYDPWGNLASSTGSSLPDFRFQGSWFDTTTSLSWVITRWYAPSLGRFVSEDSLLGDPADPPSRHLYAYGAGEPVGRWDPDGQWWKKVAVSFARSIPLGNPARSAANLFKLRIGTTGGGPFANFNASQSASMRSSSVLYTGPTATAAHWRFMRVRVTADTLSWSGQENIYVGAGSMKFEAFHRLIDVTANRTIVTLRTRVTATCAAVFFLNSPSGCGPFGDNLDKEEARLDFFGKGPAQPLIHNHRYAVSYSATISATASPWFGPIQVASDAIGFGGFMQWWQS